MRPGDEHIARLFRAARAEQNEPEMPFGFDTRVVAIARSAAVRNGGAQLLQRIAALAMIVAVAAAAGAWWQISETEVSTSNGYAIADTAIEGVLEQ